MKIKNAWMMLPALLLGLALIGLPAAHADQHNQLSYLTFDQPIQIPAAHGQMVVLPAGEYEFKLLDSPTNRNIVEIFDANNNLMGTLLTNSTEYPAANYWGLVDHTMLTFKQGAPNEPLTLVKWYYPDNNWGHEFVYPNRIESQLSEEQTITVQAVPANQVPGGAVSAYVNLNNVNANRG